MHDSGVADGGRDTSPDLRDTSPRDSGSDVVIDASGDTNEDVGADVAVDTGPVVTDAFVRIAHMVPNAGSVRICATALVGGVAIAPAAPLPSSAGGDLGIPFRGVSPYLPFPAEGIDYNVEVFLAEEIDAFNMDRPSEACPTEDDDVEPVLAAMVADALLSPGQRVTAAAIGFVREADGSTVEVCGGPCPETLDARIQFFGDRDDGPAGETAIRVLPLVPNLPAVDLCFDPDGPDMPMEEVVLFDGLTFGSASPVLERAPITAGLLVVRLDDDDCDGMMVGALPIPAPDPIGTALVPGSTKTFDADTVVTIFASGDATGTIAPPLFVPFIDG